MVRASKTKNLKLYPLKQKILWIVDKFIVILIEIYTSIYCYNSRFNRKSFPSLFEQDYIFSISSVQ